MMGGERYSALMEYIRSIYGVGIIPLHRPVFSGAEKEYLVDCINSNFVSSVGKRVTEFERRIAGFTGAKHAIATTNGTAALHTALLMAGVRHGDEVISQALTFVATCNAVSYIGAHPVFVDVDRDTMGMSAYALRMFLEAHVELRKDGAYNHRTGRRISACIAMHTFGLPCRIEEIVRVCDEYGIPVIEDVAESLGSYVGAQHTGTFGLFGALSFNGNKVITTGGGGMVITGNDELAAQAKHLTTTAKISHRWEFKHDMVGYNYRLPNLNAALGCAQMESLSRFLKIKAEVADKYHEFCNEHGIAIARARGGTTSNYWLNAIIMDSRAERDSFLEYSNAQGVMARPIWRLMEQLDMYKDCQNDGLDNSRWLEERVVNLPSSVPDSEIA